MDRLEAMSLLVAVAETGGFSAASRKRGIPLATVSRKIADLEAHLQTRLLVRTTRKVALTDAGEAYVNACKLILERVGEAERKATGEFLTPRGDLTITAPLAFGRLHVLPVVAAFLAQYPDIKVRMLLSDRTIHLIDDQIDIAVRIGTLHDSGLVATRVGAIGRVVCASPAFLATHGAPKTPADLATFPCVTFDALAAEADWSLKTADRKGIEAVRVNCRLAVNTADAAIDAAIAGVGLTQIRSYQAMPPLRDGKLNRVLRAFEPDPVPVHLLHAGHDLLPLKMRSFLEFTAPRLRKSIGV